MDLDVAHVRAFLAAAEEQHFGRAAGRLYLSQQALSKRIARLESELGVQLFQRLGHTVRLTEAGQRFCEPARQVLSAADRAIAAALDVHRPMRLDVWGHLYQPMRTVRTVIDALAGVPLEVSPSRDLPTAQAAINRGEIDVGFGRLNDVVSGKNDYVHRLVRLEPVSVLATKAHPLASQSELRPTDLRKSVLWCPASLEKLEFLHRFAEHFRIPTEVGHANLGLDQLLDDLREHPLRMSLVPADLELPNADDIITIHLVEPTPLYAWSLLWHRHAAHPSLETLLRAFAEVGAKSGWLDYRPASHWLPTADPALLKPRNNGREIGNGEQG